MNSEEVGGPSVARIVCGLFLTCALSGLVAYAEPVTLLRNSSNGFTSGTDWSDGKVPEKGKNYLVADGYYLLGDYSQKFGGDTLQFGVVGGTQGVFFKEHEGTHTFAKLILANGYYRTWLSGTDGKIAHIAGAVEVTSPASAPFSIYGTHDAGKGVFITYWDAAFSGAEGTGLRVGPMPNAQASASSVIFTGDNSSYLGSITAFGPLTTFAITTGASLGGALQTLKHDALTFQDNTIFECQAQSVSLDASLKRGITVESLGVRFKVASGRALSVGWPICGTGLLTKVGAGTLTLSGALDDTDAPNARVAVEVDEGDLVLANGFSNGAANPVTIKSGSAVTVKPGDEVSVSGLALEGGVLKVSYDEDLQASGILVLSDGLPAGSKVPVVPPTVRNLSIQFLKVPVASGEVTPDNFVLAEQAYRYDYPTASFSVSQESGFYVVTCVTRPVVEAVGTTNPVIVYPTKYSAANWSDGKLPHAGSDYEIFGDTKLFYLGSTDMPADFTFPGESLLLRGKTQYAMPVWQLTCHTFTADVRTGERVRLEPTVRSGYDTLYLRGRLSVENDKTSQEEGLVFKSAQDGMKMVVESTVCGSGMWSFVMSEASKESTYVLACTNTYTGKYRLYTENGAKVFLRFSKNENLGAQTSQLISDGFLLQTTGGLYPIGSPTIDLNRQFTVYGNAQFRVDADETFTLNSPMRVRGPTKPVKSGAGTWAVGGSVTVFDSGTPELTVSEGFLQADNARAFENIKVIVADGAGISARFDPAANAERAEYGMLVTDAAKFSLAGDSLVFRAAADGTTLKRKDRVALLTVPAATAAAIDAKTVTLTTAATGWRSNLVREDVTVGDQPFVRYVAEFRRDTGMILIFR